jgi:hypothetical protein
MALTLAGVFDIDDPRGLGDAQLDRAGAGRTFAGGLCLDERLGGYE